MNASQLLRAAQRIGEVKTVFRFPYVHVICISPSFACLEDDERELNFCNSIRVSVSELRRTLRNSLLSLRLITQDEFSVEYQNHEDRGHHWLSALIDQKLDDVGSQVRTPARVKVIHFYGYKGGQARSTLLGLLSTSLAEDGWKVLVVDSDIEAPSLDILYARTSRDLSGTLLGVVQSATSQIVPERVRTPAEGGGYVDLIACRPKSKEFDIDSSAFALRCSLEPLLIEDAARKIINFASEKSYDTILIDHRSGLSPITLPWMNTIPGPTVVCVRLDDQWLPAKQFIKLVLKTNPNNPGVFVSWKSDDESPDSYRQRNNAQIDELLDILAEIISESFEPSNEFFEETEISSVELKDHWIVWPYDSAFRETRLPEKKRLSGFNIESLKRIRSILNVSGRIIESHPSLSPSGASDEGDLIQTEALRELSVPNNPISYILGRKGTGKTRLLRELSKAGIGEPLLVDSNSQDGRGLKSPSLELSRAAELYKDNPDRLWWHLLAIAVDLPDTSTETLTERFSSEIERNSFGNLEAPEAQVLDRVPGENKRTFLMDGFETAFTAKLIFPYIEALFRFVQIIESDPRLSKFIHIKVFLRSDLAGRGYQNIEQQLFGKSILVSWDTLKIFNFLLARISRVEWYRQNFNELIENIERNRDEIIRGTLPVDVCESLLMMAFPENVNRNNLATKTFLKTYFADSASDRPDISSSDKLRYYPRVFDKFLQVIADPKPNDVGSFQGSQIENGKISQNLIFIAHEAAAREYLGQLQSELNYLISLSDDFSDNQMKVKSLLDSFEGLKTPFRLDECVAEIASKVSLNTTDIRNAIERMKSVGMFEDRPGYPGQLRVGRLFKSSLRMKYLRRPRSMD
nr:AAA family ATPase [Nodosilinea sp. TSF1-S3]MDF0369948.1 AAA family ATPase [Nodosilinea sp. TSF1-S3]